MKALSITISIPITERPKTKRVVEYLANLLEDKLTEIDGDASRGERGTVADSLGIGDCVFTVSAGKHSMEVCL